MRRRSRAAVTAQMAAAAMTSTVCRAIAPCSLTWDWSSPKKPLPNSNLLLPASAARPRERAGEVRFAQVPGFAGLTVAAARDGDHEIVDRPRRAEEVGQGGWVLCVDHDG